MLEATACWGGGVIMGKKVLRFKCKGKEADGTQCPLEVTYEYDPVIIKMAEDVVYLTCDKGHTCRYEVP